MAKSIRRTGPAVDFPLTTTFATITGLTITADFDEGELLILSRVNLTPAVAPASTAQTRITVDGLQAPSIATRAYGTTAVPQTCTDAEVIEISEGRHTIALQALKGNAGDTWNAQANSAVLTVIALPNWERDPDIT